MTDIKQVRCCMCGAVGNPGVCGSCGKVNSLAFAQEIEAGMMGSKPKTEPEAPGKWERAIAELAVELECETREFVGKRLRERLVPLLDAASDACEGFRQQPNHGDPAAKAIMDKLEMERDKWLTK